MKQMVHQKTCELSNILIML